MTAEITVFAARRVITMNPANPLATHVAVREGRILGAGTLDQVEGWGRYTLDETFRDHVVLPGFIEAHAHVFEGGNWAFPYVGYFDRKAPDGIIWRGCQTPEAVIDRLREIDRALADPAEPLLAWGFDPIYFPGERLTAQHLDRVSATRPMFLYHASGHLATVNSALMTQAGITANTTVEGVARGLDGLPNGELQEPPAMSLAQREFGAMLKETGSARAIKNYGRIARNAGCTTVADLGTTPWQVPGRVERWHDVVDDESFPARIVAYFGAVQMPGPAEAVIELVRQLQAKRRSDKLRFGGVKLFLDGSIQGFTARLSEPGYYNGAPNGIWLTPPGEFAEILLAYHRAGINVHCHCNGDEATEVFIDAVGRAVREVRWVDHRHTVQHCQMATADQFRRMARLGVCANLFTNHLWYWGDQHYELTMGPERANRLDACGTALREGVRFSIHSDAGVTPLGQLHTVWCAVNRVTPKGRVLGEHERISTMDALRAVTVDAAYQLRMDGEIGSLEAGKRADFTVLAEDPLEVEPMRLRDIKVWGTVLGGRKHQADG